MSDSTHPDDNRGSSADDGRNPIDALADSFLARLRRGEYPAISEYTAEHPELADEIRSVFPTLAMLEKGGEDLTSRPGMPDPKRMPHQIGEYRILREVGRGGMGVVYEAEHQTMRRRVALKVLPIQSAVDEVHRQRFYVEARIAGRLHHTNIVPVFEVGTDGGYHYYAMQFIRGQSLDVVFEELRRLQAAGPATTKPASRTKVAASADLGQTVAFRVASGHLEPSASDDADMATDHVAASAGGDPSGAETSPLVTAEWHDSTGRPDDYFRRVARIGLQIAEALAYAHSQRILHRDIKPSNIILDATGTAWVTDFGLAKDEDKNLTRTGDVVGTFRYMAPERFDGQADARSDVYGVGLTLYEMCALRTAFQESDRARLVQDICSAKLTKPRSVNPQIPRDLETIILKAMEPQPRGRYQAARHLADDLRLFLADHPIRARRISLGERIWRWSRRNPQQAVLAACILLLLTVLTVGALAFGYATARHARALASSQQVATERLYQALRKSADASRWSGRPGQHFTSLEDVANATQILPQLGWDRTKVERESVELRNAAIAAMSLTDMRLVRSWNAGGPRMVHFRFNPTYSCWAQADRMGTITIRSVGDDGERCELPAPASDMAVLSTQFSPDGRYLAVKYHHPDGQSLRVWDTSRAALLDAPDVRLHATASYDFDPSSTWIALGNGRSLAVFRLADGQRIREMRLAGVSRGVQVCPANRQIAVLLAGRRSMQIWNLDDSDPQDFRLPSQIWAFAWHPRSGELAVGGNDGSLRLLHLADPIREVRAFDGHTGRIRGLYFSPDGELLVSQAWDGTVRLWELSSGEQLLRTEGLHVLGSGFSRPDGRLLGMHGETQFQIWEVARDTPLRILRSPLSTARHWSVDIDPTGRWLASARDDGVELWDIRTGQIVAFLPADPREDGTSKDAEFLPDGRGLLTSNTQGVRVHLFEASPGPPSMPRPTWRVSRTLHPRQTSWASLSADGKLAAFRDDIQGDRAVVMSLAEPSNPVHLGPHPGMDHVEISPNGRWVATSTWGGRGIQVWDVRTGECVTKRPLESSESKSNIAFSPDSKRLVASTTRHHIAWDVETWEVLFRVSRVVQDDWPGPLAFSPDGTMLAAAHSRFELALLDAHSGQEIAILAAPNRAGFHDCCFSPSGNTLAAASDTEIHLWDLARVRSRLADIRLGF